MVLLDRIFPRECLGCGKTGTYLCFECKKSLIPHPELCPACHKPSSDFQVCKNCQRFERLALEGLLIGFSYQKILKKLILKLKFYHKKDIGQFLAERLALLVQMHPVLSHFLAEEKLAVSFVPSHRYRHYFVKGYNQSEILARSLASQLSIPVFPLAKKSKATASQLTLNREKRLKNLTSAFVPQNLEQLPKGICVVLVDDVTTTGATLNELAKAIKGVRPDLKIWGLVVARHTG